MIRLLFDPVNFPPSHWNLSFFFSKSLVRIAMEFCFGEVVVLYIQVSKSVCHVRPQVGRCYKWTWACYTLIVKFFVLFEFSIVKYLIFYNLHHARRIWILVFIVYSTGWVSMLRVKKYQNNNFLTKEEFPVLLLNSGTECIIIQFWYMKVFFFFSRIQFVTH